MKKVINISLNDPIAILVHPKGTIILCSKGHEVAEVLDDLHKGDVDYSLKVGKWRPFQNPVKKGDRLPLKCFCGSNYFTNGNGRFRFTKPR